MKNTNIDRRSFVKTSAAFSIGAPFIISCSDTKKARQSGDTIIGHGGFKYKVHQNWGTLDSKKTPVKNCHEMVMDAKGRMIMVGDHTKNNVLIYDKSGKLLDFWGIRYIQGHGLSLWNDGGEDFLFIADCARGNQLHQAGSVIKASLGGRELMKIDHPSKYGAYKEDEVFSPTETAIASNGDIYIADGYGSCYILQFDHKGKFIRKFGGRGDGEDQFQTAHGVCIDDRDKNNSTLLVTSRAHNAFKRFTLDGKYLETIHLPGAYVCRPVIDGENLYAGVCWSTEVPYDANNHKATHPYHISPRTGFVTILDEKNKVISNPGGTKPKYEKGELQLMKQENPVFKHCHDVCIDEDKNIYVCQWNANGTYPVKLERV